MVLASTEGLSQEAYLKSIEVGSDWLGSAVAVSGRFAVVSATGEDSTGRGVNPTPDEDGTNSGAAYVYERINGNWTFHSFLKSSNSDPNDQFGTVIAFNGEILAISAIGESSNATGVDGDETNNDAMNSGAVYIFRLDGDTWVQEAYLKASNSDTNDRFGNALALDGDTLVVGAADDEGANTETGSAYVFVRSAGGWTEEARLNATAFGNRDDFGAAVAIDGDTIVVGAPSEDGSATGVNGTVENNGNNAGAAYVFTRSGETWSEIAYLKASNTDPEDRFGSTVTISGNTIAAGSVNERGSVGGINPVSNNDTLRTGAVYVFVDNGAGWEPQATIKAAFPTRDDEFGNQVLLSGDLLVVASLEESGVSSGLDGDETTDGAASSGAVYLFTREGSTWTQARYVKASNAGGGDNFGVAIALHREDAGDLLLVGAGNEDGSSPGVNGPDNNSWGNAGAAYAFSIPRPVIDVALGNFMLQSNAILPNLGRVTIGKESQAKRFTIRNEGWADLTGLRVLVSGKQRRDFKFTQPAMKTLAPSASTTFSLTFKPRAKGARKAKLLIESNDPKENPFVLSLKGKGIDR
jgi:trimeric autotransporter adhesin